MKKLLVTIIGIFIFCAAFSQQKNDVRSGEVLSLSKETKPGSKTVKANPVKTPTASEKLNQSKTKNIVAKKNNNPLEQGKRNPSKEVLSTEEKRK